MIQHKAIKVTDRVNATFTVPLNDEAAHAYESNGMGGDNSILDLRG